MYTSKKGNIVFTDQVVNEFSVIYNLRILKYQLYKDGITLTPGKFGQTYWHSFFKGNVKWTDFI